MQDHICQPSPGTLPGPGLRPGSSLKRRIRVVAPAGPVDTGALDAGLSVLREKGYEITEGPHVRTKRGYLAGTDGERLQDLQEALNDREAEIVWFARGGYGTTKLLPDINWDQNRPAKTVAGYSDATAFHLWAQRFGNIQSLYAPSVTELGRPGVVALSSLWEALEGDSPPIPGEGDSAPSGPFPITGGCLTLCCASAGTFWSPSTNGRWVFLEEVGEKLYRLDRMLTHLAQAGWFSRAAGVLLGSFTGMGEGEHPNNVAALVRDLVPSGLPIVTDIPVGHVINKHTLPLGVPALWNGRFLRCSTCSKLRP